jgi:predicted anti-sigma-YlaC factor YlaD
MAHNNYQQMMSLALDGLLASADQADLDGHLDGCAACTAAWDAMSGLDSLFGRVAMVSPPIDFSARVMARVETRQVGRRRFETIFWFALLALMGIVLISQWVPGLVPLAASAVPVLPGPVAALLEQAEPALERLDVLRTALVTLGEALTLWLTYIASLPATLAAGLATMALVATWVGLIGVFGPAQTAPMAREAVRIA